MSTFKDRKGQRFGKLKVIKRGLNGKSSNGRSYIRWWCVCDCGFKCILVDASLITRQKSCGCLSRLDNLKGKKFGELTVIERGEDSKGKKTSQWWCICSCNEHKKILIRSGSLKRGMTSCGCKRIEDLSGKKFNRWNVVRRGPNLVYKNSTAARWWCMCECGNPQERLVRGTDLKKGRSKSCGCLLKDLDKSKSELGNMYEKLTVIERGPNSFRGSAKWWCRCECGNLKLILGASLRQGLTKSCGCAQKEILKNHYLSPENLAKRRTNHLKKVDKFKRVELIGEYKRDNIKTEYKCLLHQEIHLAYPTNVARGFGLKCCQLIAVKESSEKKKSDAEERYINFIQGKFKLIEDYQGKEIQILHFCLKHKELHLASPSQINKGSGLKCCGREKLKIKAREKSENASRLYDSKIAKFGKLKRIGKYIRSDVAIMHECLVHSERHTTSPDSAIQGGGLKCCFIAGRNDVNQKKSDQFLNKLIIYCQQKNSKVTFIDGYTTSNKPANFYCNIHNKYLQGYPQNVLKGSGLGCCRRGGVDTLDQAIDGEIWNQDEETWVYIYELENHAEFLKFGISNDPEERSADEEYGEEVCLWLMSKRLDAFLIEEAIFHQTAIFQEYPAALSKWTGYTEIRKCTKEDLTQLTQSLIDHFYDVGRWQFVLDEIPLSLSQETKVKQLKMGLKN